VTTASSSRYPLSSPPPAQPGDRVAILSPSWAAPAVFPEVHEIGLRVVREQLDLVPVEYPTTRQLNASPQDRARDLVDAFEDDSIKAVMATIGGSDEITVLPYLNREVISSHPKRFFGYSDNTNLLNYLWNLGIVGYHGGSTFVHLARPGGVHSVSFASLRSAVFTNNTVELAPVHRFTDFEGSWEDVSTLDDEVPTEHETGWYWHNSDRVVSGPTWGGNLEIIHWNLAANRWIRPNEDYEGCVLILETSEEMPPSDEVFRMLRNMGERELLERFAAVVVAKPKAWHRDRRNDAATRRQYRDDQRDAVLRALATYNPDALVVIGPDFGHTDPQYIVPYGGLMTVDGPAERITMTY
jgi:muramoyltetrapeptide carboxypeptidase LdcA involved in peptidoglycan recycling